MESLDIEPNHYLSVRRERWFQCRMKFLTGISSVAYLLDLLSGAWWCWIPNLLTLGGCFLIGRGDLPERSGVVVNALMAVTATSLQTVAGMTRLTTSYAGFFYCHNNNNNDEDYSCATRMGIISIVAAFLWFVATLVWAHAMMRIFRPSLWVRWNLETPILFLSVVATGFEVLGGAYWGWLFNLLCIVGQVMGSKQQSCGRRTTAYWYVGVALLALTSGLLQGYVAGKEALDDVQTNLFCPPKKNDDDNTGSHYPTSSTTSNGSCPMAHQAMSLAGAIIWLAVVPLALRYAVIEYKEEEGMTSEPVVTERVEYGLIQGSSDDVGGDEEAMAEENSSP